MAASAMRSSLSLRRFGTEARTSLIARCNYAVARSRDRVPSQNSSPGSQEVNQLTSALSQSVITKLLPVEHMVHYTHSVFSECVSPPYIITRVAPHCVNTLRILHAAYDYP